ncbi:MAG: CheR family methyltransferase [Acidobacteriota bacterium]
MNIDHAVTFEHTPSEHTQRDKKKELINTVPSRVSMQDTECVAFLQWALPKLHMRWAGFRKIRRRVCKRVTRRLKSLGLLNVFAYRTYLETHPEEWARLDEVCWIPISRFYRDRAIFDFLAGTAFPSIAQAALAKGSRCIRAWSAGCCAGEEPYTLMLLWQLSLQSRFPDVKLEVLATDIDASQLDRAAEACYPFGSLRDLPAPWIELAFEAREGRFCLRTEYRTGVRFQQLEIRMKLPDGLFDLVLCRNLAFTYFDDALQAGISKALQERIVPRGVMVLGRHEALPAGTVGFREIARNLHVYCSHCS